MHSNTIMNQLLTILPRHQFDQAVSDFGGDHYAKKFSTWNQLTVLLYLYTQAAGKNSLRDIQTALGTQELKLYHLGPIFYDTGLHWMVGINPVIRGMRHLPLQNTI
ncbi:MAG: DUF4372 domain-containing protein [Elusimicrobiota bacterium]